MIFTPISVFHMFSLLLSVQEQRENNNNCDSLTYEPLKKSCTESPLLIKVR